MVFVQKEIFDPMDGAYACIFLSGLSQGCFPLGIRHSPLKNVVFLIHKVMSQRIMKCNSFTP